MKDAYEVLYQKEVDLVRVRQEVESLRVVASMLTDDARADEHNPVRNAEQKKPSESLTTESETVATGTDGRLSNPRQPRFWEFLKPVRRAR